MNALDLPLSTRSLEIGLGLLALGLLFGAWLSRRARVQPLGYWPLAWAVLVAMGALRVAGGAPAVEYSGTVIYYALMLAGAYRYADRDLPTGFFPGAAGIAALLLALAYSPAVELAAYATRFLAPLSLVFSAVIAWPAAVAREALLHRLVPFGLLALAALGVYDDVGAGRSVDSITLWLLVAIPIATNQAVAIFDRIRQRADDIARELEESVSLLQATLESTADGILVVATDGRYASFNRTFAEMWGIPSEILESQRSEPVLRFVMQQLADPEQFYETVQSLYRNRDAESFDTLEFADGRVFERYSRPQKVGNEIVGRVWSFRDISQRRRAEEIAAEYKDHLEVLVDQRTRELVASRDRLRQADRMVAIGTLAAGVAHQINNPIGAIMNSAEYALQCEQDAEAHEIFRRALVVNAAEAKRCGDIVRGMLQFARQEPVEKLLEDLNQVVRRALKAVDSYARDRGARIELALSDSPIETWMSPIEMEQVVVNLLRNAIESRESGVFVDVRTSTDGEWSHLEISDNGRGIDEKDRQHIFDPFYSTRLMQGGTGLGLSVAHGILKDHGGKIRVESPEEETGTTLVVELPTAPPDAPRPPAR